MVYICLKKYGLLNRVYSSNKWHEGHIKQQSLHVKSVCTHESIDPRLSWAMSNKAAAVTEAKVHTH